MAYYYDGYSSVGYKREDNEDYLSAKALDANNEIVFAVVADGSGSKPSQLQPAQIACRYMEDYISRIYNDEVSRDFLLTYPIIFLKEALLLVNSVLGAFRTANEEIYSGFMCSLTSVLFYTTKEKEHKMAFAHCGNTRLYLIRRSNDGNAQIRQITKDHTEGQILVDKKIITPEQYYLHDARNKLLCPLGFYDKPKFDVFNGKIKDDCIFLITTDGIHCAIRPEPMTQLVLENDNLHNACVTLCDTAKNLQYNDDYCAFLCRIV